MAETIKIGGEIESTATGNKVADVANIKDKTKGNKSQAQINAELETALEERYTKSETYNKTQLDNMITTPETAYKDYDTYADMVAETVHPAGAIYRVANYDGTQAVTNKYAEYSWDGTQYKLMAVRDHGIDEEPTAGSDNLVKSGGVQNELALGAVYDVSAKNPTAGPNNDGKWESLSALLSDANLNTLVPTAVRKGGMSIKFVCSSDNMYVQYRCMAQNFTTDVTKWQGIDAEPTVWSKNLVESGGIVNSLLKCGQIVSKTKEYNSGTWNTLFAVELEALSTYKLTVAIQESVASTVYCYLTTNDYVDGQSITSDVILASAGFVSGRLSNTISYENSNAQIVKLVVYCSNAINFTGSIKKLNTIETEDIKNSAVTLDKLNNDCRVTVTKNTSTGEIKLNVGSTENVIIGGVDKVPTIDSEKFVESGGVYDESWKIHSKALNLGSIDALALCSTVGSIYVRYSDGVRPTSTNLHTTYWLDLTTNKVNKLYCKLGLLDDIPAAVAFYSNTNGDSSSYIKTASVQAIQGAQWYEVNIPSNAKLVIFSNNSNKCSNPIVLGSNYDVLDYYLKEYLKGKVVDKSVNLFANEPYYYHFRANSFIQDEETYNIIASQSLEDIDLAARLGFKFIEANTHETADGHFICIHGNSGKFGTEVESTDESHITTATLQDTLISSMSLSDIKTYVRYRTQSTKTQTSIPTLEEFCSRCKTNNIGIFCEAGGKKAVIDICKQYISDNFIVYGPPTNIRDYFSGYVYVGFYTSASITYQDALDRLDQFGAPAMYGIGADLYESLVTNNKLEEFITKLHEKGYLIGMAYQSEADARLATSLGMDFYAATHEVNPFASNYEYFDLDSPDLPTTTGTISGNERNRIIELVSEDTITCGSTSKVSAGKGFIEIKFNGSLTFSFGSLGSSNRTIISDGTELITISDYFFQRKTQLVITANSNTSVTHFVYKTSKC